MKNPSPVKAKKPSKPAKRPPSLVSITTLQSLPPFHTHNMFRGKIDDTQSPLDQFISNTQAINVLYKDYISGTIALPAELASVVLLGYMSAVESYIRKVYRGLILVDEHMSRLAETMTMTYGAAMHSTYGLLPEALMEDKSFVSRKVLEDSFREIAGIKGNFPSDIKVVLGGFERICELRHCCVHRFGKLGSKNASKLGLPDHKAFLETPFSPDVNELQSLLDTLRTSVKTINNYLCREVLARTVRTSTEEQPVYQSWTWKWDLRSDKPKFRDYYYVFASSLDAPPSPDLASFYKSFKASYGPGAA